MKIVLAFDSFKGSLSAREACSVVAGGIRSARPDIETVALPMADGGEGTAEALMTALGGEWVPLTVTGPLRTMRVKAGFAWIEGEKTAVVETAAASGLTLLKDHERNPMETTTYGTGELIRAAVEKGARRILLAVGGSATVDGGLGAASALGWRFLGSAGREVPGSGKGAGAVAQILPPEDLRLPEVEVLCDVTNPLCGPNGAARIYGPQKGATPEMVELLDANLRHLAEEILRCLGKDVCDLPGAGAAGGLSAGAVAFMGGKLVRGIDTVMRVAGLAGALQGAEWVLTGEGRFDSQSLQGKVVAGVARLARQSGVKTGVLSGSVQLSESEWRAAGVDFATAVRPGTMSVEESMRRAAELLFGKAVAFARGL